MRTIDCSIHKTSKKAFLLNLFGSLRFIIWTEIVCGKIKRSLYFLPLESLFQGKQRFPVMELRSSVVCIADKGQLFVTPFVSVEWETKKIFEAPVHVGCLLSNIFSFSDADWYLSIFTNGNCTNSIGWISLFLNRSNDLYDDHEDDYNDVHRVSFTLGIKKCDGSVFTSFKDQQVFRNYETEHGTSKLVQRFVLSDSKNIIAPNGVLRVFCTARIVNDHDVEADSMTSPSRSILTLAQNFENLYLSGREFDVTIQVKEQKFQAHRLVLAARSTVFSSMFKHDMLEKNNGVVKIVDCDSDSFKDFLHFIYSGKLDIVSSENACSLYVTSDKYDMNDLKEECCLCMANTISVETFCDTLLLASLHNESVLLETATEYFIHNTKAVLSSTKWQSLITENPLLGNELFLKVVEENRKSS